MKQLLSILVFLLAFTQIQAQKEASIWYFGNNAGLDFNSGAPVVLTDGALVTREGCSTIADQNGNLMFYTDGITVWNRNHQEMPNGNDLEGHPSSTQSGIIVPNPGNPDIYYVFTADFEKSSDGIKYSVIDLTLDTGLGGVVQKNIPLLAPATEKLTAVKHANNNDIWVLTHDAYGDTFYAYLVTSTGVSTTPVTSSLGVHLTTTFFESVVHAAGYFKISPDGSKAAITHQGLGVNLLDFDSASGTFSNAIRLDDSIFQTYYGLEFSPSGQVLYLNDLWGNLYQFDTYAADVLGSRIQLAANQITSGALQLAIDGKIYMVDYDMPTLSVIEDPDVLGIGCTINFRAIDLAGRLGVLGLPPFIQSYFLQSDIKAENFCSGVPTDFELTVSEPILSVTWDFGDGNSSTLENPSNTYANGGVYTVSATIVTAIETKTETKEITIYQTPVANTITDIDQCSLMANVEFNLLLKNSEILGAQSAALYNIAYFPTLVDAENNTNPLPNLYANTLASETLHVRIENIQNTGCFAVTDFELVVKLSPELHAAVNWTVCDIDTDGLYNFDLSQKDAEIYNGQNTAVFDVRYFESQADADSNMNSIGPSYTNTNPTEQIFYRIQNTTHIECYETGSFMIEVITGVTANIPSDLEVCDNDNDGFFTFDLTDVETEVLGSQNPASFNVSYHSSITDAENRLNAHTTNYTNTSPDSETVYVRVENNANSSCYATTTFELRVYDSPVLQSVSDWSVCDLDNDGTYTFDLSQKDNEVLGSQSAADFLVSYHLSQTDADSNQNIVSNTFTNTTNPQTIYYRLQSAINAHCYVSDSFVLQVFDQPTANNPSDENVCADDETGINSFDLSQKDAEILNGQDATQYQVSYFNTPTDALNNSSPLPKNDYRNSTAEDILFARVHHVDLIDCFAISQFTIRVSSLVQPDLEEMYVICPDSPELTIDGGEFERWSWKFNTIETSTDRTISITALGDYTLTVTQTTNGVVCENTIGFEVVSSGAPDDFITEIKGFSDTVIIEVNAIGEGEFEYSSDGENFQDNNKLEVPPGTHTVSVRDKFLCRTISKEVIALGYRKFFTPNGDGVHEYWNIIGAELFPGSQLYIYDRYGKLVGQVPPLSQGWNGTYNGVRLPSTDYWFRYSYDNGKVFRGHFALKR